MQDQGAGRQATHRMKKNESRIATVCEESDHGASSAVLIKNLAIFT